MLQGIDIGYRHPARDCWLLRDATVAVGAGEVVGLCGRSGEGKTTLAKILAGFIRPAAGRVLVDNAPLPSRGYCPVQLVFQHPELAMDPFFSMEMALDEGHGEWRELAAPLLMDRLWLKRFPHELSSGELQRIALARALGPATRYLIADETTSMLDAITQASVWKLLLQLAQTRKIGILAVSHDHALLKRIAHRVVNINSLGSGLSAGSAIS